MKRASTKIVLALLIIVFSCSGIAHADKKEVLAQIGNKTITSADLEMLIGFYPEHQRALIRGNPENREAFIKDLVTIMVVSNAAKKKGYEKNKAIKRQVQLIKDQLLANAYLTKEIIEKVTVSDQDVQDFYGKNRKLFEKPEQARARHILVAVKQGAADDVKAAAKKKAEELLDRVRKGEDFAKLAGEFSDDPGSKQKGGDLGFFPKNSMIPEFDKAAFALEPGGISGVVETSFGYHIIKVEEKKKAELPPYETVKEEARSLALQAARQERVGRFIDKSFKEAGVKFYLKPAGKNP
jgi:peptidyl-prolyl cis-trans isomerase C